MVTSSKRALVVPFLWSSLLLAQVPASTPKTPPILQPEVVLAQGDSMPLVAQFGLGDGGLGGGERGELRFVDDGCVTSGGVRIECRLVGVKLTFPSGRELLVAPDGHLHLRSGEMAGPFAGGLALHLADGAVVRIALAPSNAERLRDVHVVEGDMALQPWRRGEPSVLTPRRPGWAGLNVACCGDGSEVYRTIALGPLVVLDRVLVAAGRAADAPLQRLVVLTAPLLRSLERLPRQHRETDAPVRQAVAAVTAIAERGDSIFPVGASLQRVERERLRWQLQGGFELQLDLAGQMAPRLQLFAGDSVEPTVEWTLRADAAAFLLNPREDQPGNRWHGNGTRLDAVARELQAREELFERGYALRVIERLWKRAPKQR